MGRRKTRIEAVVDFKNRHGDLYLYDKVVYVNNKTNILIGCQIDDHGYFPQQPIHHQSGSGCPKCGNKTKGLSKHKRVYSNKIKLNKENFKEISNDIHNNIYDYSRSVYVYSTTLITIGCSIHGWFDQTPYNHTIKKSGCKKCANDKMSSVRKKDIMELENQLEDIHGKKYKFQLSNYKDNKCVDKKSKGEIKIVNYLSKNNILYETQKTFKGLKNIRSLYFDFYLPEHNVLIEYDGRQHFEPVKHFGGEKMFNMIRMRDGIKNRYCEDNNILLIRIPYTKFKNLETILENNL